jgi:plastocyanin
MQTNEMRRVGAGGNKLKVISTKRLASGALAVGTAAALVFNATGSASAQGEAERGTPTISMEQDGNQLYFDGPKFVSKGQDLRIVNNTDPQQVGPHTFSLTKQELIPSNGNEAKACGKLEKESVCDNIAKAHELDFETGKVGRKFVDSGREGWNLLFRSKGKTGDTWYTHEQGEQKTKVVSARNGKTLSYFCVIHPQMQGSVQVTIPGK